MNRDLTPTRSAALDLRDERRAMQEGYTFLDEKCLVLAAEMLAEIDNYTEAARGFRAAGTAAAVALAAAISRHGFDAVEVLPPRPAEPGTLSVARRALMGVPLADAGWQPTAAHGGGAGERAAVSAEPGSSPEAAAAAAAFAALVARGAVLGALAGNLERLSREYRRTVRRARALSEVLLPELDRTIADIETRLEELEQEDAILLRSTR
jgi:V/A-type H+/Na+-transporting ATPase subunit D